MCPVYEGKPVSEENISFWEQVFNEGFINFQSLSQTGFSETTATSNLENMLSCTEGECFLRVVIWTELGCFVIVHWRARVNLKFFATRASWKIIQEVSNSWRASASRMTAAYFMSIKTVSFEGSWRLSHSYGMFHLFEFLLSPVSDWGSVCSCLDKVWYTKKCLDSNLSIIYSFNRIK